MFKAIGIFYLERVNEDCVKMNVKKRGIYWNAFASIMYSLQSALLVLVITRTSDLYIAGIFTIAYTMTQMMSAIGNYGMRSFHASDVGEEYKFSTYHSARIISCLLMVICCIVYAKVQKYQGIKMMLVLILCVYRMIESYEDVVHGEMQRRGKLDIAARNQGIRICVSTLLFMITFAVGKDLVFSSLVMLLSTVVIAARLNREAKLFIKDVKILYEISNTKRLLVTCFPICISNFLYTYLVNLPKYSIDRNLNEESQSIFSILFMPVFVINVLSSFIFKPLITEMGHAWINGKQGVFRKELFRQSTIIVGMTICVALGCYWIGIDVLAWLYAVELQSYRLFLVVLMLFGGISALVSYYVVVLTIMRKQIWIGIAYGIAVVFDWLCVEQLVRKLAIHGAGIVYGCSMLIVLIVLVLVMLFSFGNRKKRIVNVKK